MHDHWRSARVKATIVSALLASVMGSAGGCYRHVVRAEGASPGRYEIHEPNLKLEDEQPAAKRRAARQDKDESDKKFLGLF